jgi:lipopolysaccharide transport system ATP-binding protein
MKAAISVEKVSKLYRLGASKARVYSTLRESILNTGSALWKRLRGAADPPSAEADLWALKDVSLEIQPGEVIGVIGRNGAGKSTFLKVLSRITEPTTGRVELRGRVGSLLEVGTGFHSELTGRENIYLNGAICGMGRREIARKFDDIVSFAEVDRFLDTPVKRYSSGMFVRLAFAVACHMEPEILLVDEVLAVGDQAFQKKCLGKMNEVSRSGRTVLFVSHNMATILNLCQKVATFAKGRLLHLGAPEESIRLYVSQHGAAGGAIIDLADHPGRRLGCTPILGGLRLLDGEGNETTTFPCGAPLRIEVTVRGDSPVAEPHLAIGFEDTFGVRLFTVATYLSGSVPDVRTKRMLCRLDSLNLTPGRYGLTLNAGPLGSAWTDIIDQAAWFDITPTDFYGNGKLPNPDWGRFLVRSRWENA